MQGGRCVLRQLRRAKCSRCCCAPWLAGGGHLLHARTGGERWLSSTSRWGWPDIPRAVPTSHFLSASFSSGRSLPSTKPPPPAPPPPSSSAAPSSPALPEWCQRVPLATNSADREGDPLRLANGDVELRSSSPPPTATAPSPVSPSALSSSSSAPPSSSPSRARRFLSSRWVQRVFNARNRWRARYALDKSTTHRTPHNSPAPYTQPISALTRLPFAPSLCAPAGCVRCGR